MSLTVCILWSLLVTQLVNGDSVLEGIARNPKLTRFNQWISKEEVLRMTLNYKSVTVFAPTDETIEAFEKREGRYSESQISSLVNYHIVGMIVEKHMFPTSVTTQEQKFGSLFLNTRSIRSKTRPDLDEKQYFVNNAQITQDVLGYKSSKKERQILYIIDQVLKPFPMKDRSFPPLAYDLIERPSIYDIKEYSFFSYKINEQKKQDMFKQLGNHTFFVPIEDYRYLGNEFDSYTVKGHVIQNRVLFLRVMGEESFKTSAYDENVQVELSLQNQNNTQGFVPGTQGDVYVQADIIKNRFSQKGKIMSRVIRGNIPVKNGVIHFIEKPLMTTGLRTIEQLTERRSKTSIFINLLNYAPRYRNLFEDGRKTILVPIDGAFSALDDERSFVRYQEKLTRNPEMLSEFFDMHIVDKTITMADVRNTNEMELNETTKGEDDIVFRLVQQSKRAKLTIKIVNETIMINATSIQPDILTSEGNIIQIIDRVLNKSFDNMEQKLYKLRNCSFLQKLARQMQPKWSDQLADNETRFTLFAPSDLAWERFRRTNPTDYYNFNNGLELGQAKKILDSHLAVNQEVSVDDFRAVEVVKTVESWIKYDVKSNTSQLVSGKIQANFSTADIRTQNGIIHVIDHVIYPITSHSQMIVASVEIVAMILLTTIIF